MVLHFQPKKNSIYKIKKISNLEKVTNIIFSNKRKMINKSLKKLINLNEVNKNLDLKTNLRPTELKPDVYYKITELFEKKN